MAGIGLIIFMCIWGAIAIWIGIKLSNFKLFTSFTKSTKTKNPTWWDFPVKAGLIIVVFFLPLADEILSYPTYDKLCENSGKYQFAPGMNEKNVFGRDYRINLVEEKRIRLFPSFRELLPNESSDFGVTIRVTKLNLIDDKTGQLLLNTQDIVPLHSFSALKWDGSYYPWLLTTCTHMVGINGKASQNFIRSLELHLIYHLE